jgi:hypothetical protein
MKNMESRLATWIENQVKRNSSANLMAVTAKVLHPLEDTKKYFSHEANLEFMANTG